MTLVLLFPFKAPYLEPAKFILKEGKNPKVIKTVISVFFLYTCIYLLFP
jgi:hypothetical protein